MLLLLFFFFFFFFFFSFFFFFFFFYLFFSGASFIMPVYMYSGIELCLISPEVQCADFSCATFRLRKGPVWLPHVFRWRPCTIPTIKIKRLYVIVLTTIKIYTKDRTIIMAACYWQSNITYNSHRLRQRWWLNLILIGHRPTCSFG